MANEKLSQKSAATTPLTGAELLYAVQDGVSVSVTVDDVAARASGSVQGTDGASAYEVAVANGFVGTEPEWLLSLVGADSTVPGPQGEQGLQGIQGEVGPAGADSVVPGPQGEQGLTGETGAGLNILGSFATLIDLQAAHPTGTVGDAYLIVGNLYVWDGAWSDVGNIQGPQGIPGADGLQGIQGPAGADGLQGVQGEVGPQGIQGIQGVKGDTGDAGADSTVAGPQGIQGVAGETGPAGVGIPTGGTAGQVLAKVDATDYNSVWVDPATGSGLTNPMTTAGDIIVGGVAGAPTRLAKGVDGQVLAMVAGVPAYADAGGGSATIDWTSPIVVNDTTNLAYGKHYIVAVTAADKTLTLPEITAADYGKMIVVEIAAATTKLITIDGYAAQGIDGSATRIMWAKEVAQLVATVNGWTKVAGKDLAMAACMYPTAVGTATAAVWTKIITNAVLFTSVASFADTANKRLVIPRDGNYLLKTQMLSDKTNTSSTRVLVGAAKNTVIGWAAFAVYDAPTLNRVQPTFIDIVPLLKGDIIEQYAMFEVGSFPTYFSYGADIQTSILLTEQV